MSEQKPGFIAQLKSYPSAFWIANTMEIFERMAWYGFFTVSTVYITGPVETGALGFTSEQRGQLQAIVSFFLYLFTLLTGALADRYGYRRLFIIAYLVMIASYYSLGQFHTFPTFLIAFMFVAVGAALFKPVVVGTVARVTNESNSATAFGIFYMMVNIGGFLGPIIAGAVRGISWDYVFIACSSWAGVNLLIAIFLYKDPSTEASSGEARTLQKVLDDMVEVLGNLRFFVTVFTVLLALMLANQEYDWFTWTHLLYFVPLWILANFLYDMVLPQESGRPQPAGAPRRNPFAKRMHCSNWRFALFLLIMSGFWTSFQQIFITMPEYIRDYADTKPMVNAGRTVFGWIGKDSWIDYLANIEEPELLKEFDSLIRRARGVSSMVPAKPKKALSEEEIPEKIKEVLAELEKLKRSFGVIPSEMERIDERLARFADADTSNVDAVSILLVDAKKLKDDIDRQKRIRRLATDPSLTDEERLGIDSALADLNAPGAAKGLEPVDLVDGVRRILQYKVRIQPTELAGLMGKVLASSVSVGDEDLDRAVKSINRRLSLDGKPEIVDEEEQSLRDSLKALIERNNVLVPQEAVVKAAHDLSTDERELEPTVLAVGVRDLAYRPVIWPRIDAGRQVNPEHIVNFDAGAIVLFQVMVSFFMARFHRFTTMIVGMLVAAVGIGLSGFAGGTMLGPVGASLFVVIVGILTFAFGEMMASPTSQDYVARIAPKNKTALYMGYYFVSIALGNLFSGILSGQLSGKLARDMQRPDLMWFAFGGVMLLTAVAFLLYNQFALPKAASMEMTNSEA